MIAFYLMTLIVTIYLILIVYVIYGVNFPSQCKLNENKFCLTPIYHKNERINIKLFLTSPERLNRKHTIEPLWQIKNISMASDFVSDFYINISTTMLNYQKNILGSILIEKHSVVDKDNINWDSIFIPISFIIFKNVKSRTIYKDLLSTNETNPTIENKSTFSNFPRPHWKYAIHPLLIRLVSYGDISLSHSFLPNLVEQLDTRQIPPSSSRTGYMPITYIDDMSLLSSQLKEIAYNNSNDEAGQPQVEVYLKFKFSPISPLYFAYKKICKEMLAILSQFMAENELEEFRWWMSDERLFRMFLTQAISTIHILLEYLAFRDDWRFFHGRKNFRGISISAIVLSILKNIIFFFYLYDNNTSSIVLISIVKDIIYQIWKIWKIKKLSLRGLLSFLFLNLFLNDSTNDGVNSDATTTKTATTTTTTNDANASNNINNNIITNSNEDTNFITDITKVDKDTTTMTSYNSSISDDTTTTTAASSTTSTISPVDNTDELDRVAITYVGLSVYPLLLGTALYSLRYYRHKSWWSWLINSFVDVIYLAGFVSLTPQLYINYRLKSVAHLPIRAFVYKIFSTFIDDVFAMIIVMPMKHRIMTLRDDVIFLIFLYQWWIYPKDKARPNEFGFQYEPTSSSPSLSVDNSSINSNNGNNSNKVRDRDDFIDHN